MQVLRLTCELTYVNLLLGQPTAEVNGRILRRAIAEAEKMYPEAPVHLLPPSIDRDDPSHPILPQYILSASLSSLPFGNDCFGSWMILIWLISAEELATLLTADLVSAAVSQVDWESIAKDYDL